MYSPTKNARAHKYYLQQSQREETRNRQAIHWTLKAFRLDTLDRDPPRMRELTNTISNVTARGNTDTKIGRSNHNWSISQTHGQTGIVGCWVGGCGGRCLPRVGTSGPGPPPGLGVGGVMVWGCRLLFKLG